MANPFCCQATFSDFDAINLPWDLIDKNASPAFAPLRQNGGWAETVRMRVSWL